MWFQRLVLLYNKLVRSTLALTLLAFLVLLSLQLTLENLFPDATQGWVILRTLPMDITQHSMHIWTQ